MTGLQRILIFSDSLALPRNKEASQILDYEDTWPCLLRRAYPSLVVGQVSIGSATTEEIVYQTQYWTGFKPDLTIFQLGLCDCLPRALRAFELEIVKRLPYSLSIRKWIAKHSRALRDFRGGITLTDLESFKSRVSTLRKAFPQSVWLSILVNKSNHPANFPRGYELARKYNRAISGCFGDDFVELGNIGDKQFLEDGFHLNREGHRLVWETLEKILGNVERIR